MHPPTPPPPSNPTSTPAVEAVQCALVWAESDGLLLLRNSKNTLTHISESSKAEDQALSPLSWVGVVE